MTFGAMRIEGVVNTLTLSESHVIVVGCGGSADLVAGLARCGVGRFTLIDPDLVRGVNLARQGFLSTDVGRPKVTALARHLTRVNPACQAHEVCDDLLALPTGFLAEQFRTANLVIGATDRFSAQARVNELALAFRVPALWPGLYEGGLSGEIIFWVEGLPCYRCLVPSRYAAQAAAQSAGVNLDPESAGTTVFDQAFVDAIAGMLALGLLTRGSANRFGSLIDLLGDRNFIHVKNDPRAAWCGRDVVREQLKISPDVDGFFAWNTAARRDPDAGRLYCPDCERHLGKQFGSLSTTCQ